MDNIIEIKEKLDSLYEEYKQNKSQLNTEKTKEVVKLLIKLTYDNEGKASDVAAQLARFSADVVNIYFETITKGASIPVDVLDEIICEFLLTDKEASKSQHYVQKFVFTITSIMKNYRDKAITSVQLPRLVVFIARFAVKSEKHRNKFQTLINNTTGGIFMLDYTGINRNSLVNIWNTTNNLFPDISKCRYESFITEWGIKYGFIIRTSNESPISDSAPAQVEEPAVDVSADKNKTEAPVPSNENRPESEEKAELESEEKTQAFETEPVNYHSDAITMQKLFDSLKSDMTKERQTIISAINEMLTPVSKALESVQGEITKSRSIGADNAALKSKTEQLERQLSEQRESLQEANRNLTAVKSENEELKKQVAELDKKLNDAYSLNSREASLEAEKIRTELKKAFQYLYEDWLEYEFSDVSEDNYESLQAIIKKFFRALDRNGINYKENK